MPRFFRSSATLTEEVISNVEPDAHYVQGNERFDNHDGVLTVQNICL